MSILSKKHFNDETAAFEYLESTLWPDGPTCPHCGNVDASRITKLRGKAHRLGVHKCNECRQQFTVKVGGVIWITVRARPRARSVIWITSNARGPA